MSYMTLNLTLINSLQTDLDPDQELKRNPKADSDSDNAQFVLLRINYTKKINLRSIGASHFDESYASTGHNGKISWFFTQRR